MEQGHILIHGTQCLFKQESQQHHSVAGPYTVIVTDANLCTATVNVTIAQPAAALTVTTSQVDVACFGGTTGTATAIPAGGTGPYTYSWNTVPVETGITATGLGTGPYTVTVTDANLCTATANVTITQPAAALTVTTSQVDITCFGGTTGTATAIPAGGAGSYTYSWNTVPVQTGITATGLGAGPYTVTVTDVNMCTATANVTIIQPATALTVTTSHVNVACFGGTTGTATAIPAGGTGVYTYSWNTIPVQTTAVATGLAAGTYIVTVDDSNGCSGTASTIITEPASSLSGSITSLTNVSVFGANDGTVTVDGSGGTLPYQYKIGSGTYQVSGTFGALIAGTYTVTVQDINLCTFDVPVTITQPSTTLSGNITSQTNVACFGASTGSVTVTGLGGSTPYDYSLNAGTFQTSGTFTGLAAGTYTITVRDALLITFDISVTITQPASALGGFIASQTNVLCFGSNTGNVTIAGSGGVSPYLYKLAGGSYQASGLFETLTAGPYTVTIQDANLCTFDVSVNITQPLAILAVNTLSSANVLCFGSANGSVNVSGSGGTSPYMFSLNGGTYQASGSFSNLTAATYTISVQDANLCIASITVAITEPEALSIASTTVDASCPDIEDGSITLTITGGKLPYTTLWVDNVITQDRTNIPTGNYRVVVTDVNSCAAALDVVVGVGASEKCLEIPTIITPNNDGFNDTWKIKNIDLFPNAEVFIYNRWGELVFNSKNLSANQWNGTYKGRILPTDSYHYILYLNDGSRPRSGVISIIR